MIDGKRVEELLAKAENGDLDAIREIVVKLIEPSGAKIDLPDLRKMEASLAGLDIGTTIAIVKAIKEVVEYLHREGYIEIPSLGDKNETGSEIYYYYLDNGVKNHIKNYLSEQIREAEVAEENREAVAYKYGLVFGEVQKRDIKVDAFFSFEDLRTSSLELKDEIEACIDALVEIDAGIKKKYSYSKVSTFIVALSKLIENLGDVSATDLLLAVRGKKIAAPGFMKWLDRVPKEKSRKESFETHIKSRLLGIYVRSRHIQKRNTPLRWLDGYYCMEKQSGESGAYVTKPEKKIYIETNYKDFIEQTLKGLRKYANKGPPIALCFAGYEKTENEEELKKSMKSPKMDETSSTCLAYIDKELYRILCKKAPKEKVDKKKIGDTFCFETQQI
ncbi:MAG: hypothetical protein ABIG20_05150 [archaeon]